MNIIKSNHLKQNPFLVPSGYFDSLPIQVGQKIGAKPVWSVAKTLKPFLSLAASFLVLFGLGYGILTLTTSKRDDVDPLFTESAISQFDSYLLLNNLEEFDEGLDSDEIITYLTEHGVSHFLIAALD